MCSSSRAPGILLLLAIAVAVPAGVDGQSPESESFAKQRQQLKHRQRRIIYNNDGGDIYAAGANTPEGFLAVRMKPTLDTQVDSVFYCTGATTMFSHQAKVGEVYGKYTAGASDPFARHIAGNIAALADLGTDALALVVDFCHKNNLEVFFTHRINDIHDSFLDWELSTWKREHPEYLFGVREDVEKYPNTDPRCRWSGLDFEVPEVRTYLLAIIDDVLARYDVDGIEIDYFRSPCFFRPNLTFQPATAEQVGMLTSFQRRVRELTYQHGNNRGRPILVATRVPMTKQTCLHVGIDIDAWLKEALLDVLTTGGGYMPFTMPTRESVELGRAHDVPVYPTISASGMTAPHNTDAHWRGAAANAWLAGADGVYLFNTFPSRPKHPHFTELGDPAALARMDKVFVMDNVPVLSGGLVQGIEQSQILPVKLDPDGKPREVVLPLGDDIKSAADSGVLKTAQLRIQFAGGAGARTVEVRLNGEIIKPADGAPPVDWVTYDARPEQYRRGDNVLAFRESSGNAQGQSPIEVRSVTLAVNYR
ncbi:MAG: family 10 glycosylhydrolase [Planctomycetota bacterium]